MTIRSDTHGPLRHLFSKFTKILDGDGKILRGFVLLVYTEGFNVPLFARPFAFVTASVSTTLNKGELKYAVIVFKMRV